ncbi:MAG TPA: glutamyl-tRNA reductase [Dehalococcoidia bacterium]|nr:glutamyl-tRNA reductase [Dehalococcoidia bacterium]
MFVSVTGVSHHETPVELRERFAFGADQLTPALSRLPPHLGGGVILSTCNRTELYLAGDSLVDSASASAALAQTRGESGPEGVSFYHHEGSDAVRHLYRVAAGIESLVIGESEILGQVREAFAASTAAESSNAVLARLFHTAMRVGRRARNETDIGAHGLSISALAVSLSRRLVGDLGRKTVLVVGAGDAGRRAAGALVQNGVGRLLVTTRRSGLAEEIASELNGVAIPYSDLTSALAEADVLITATAAPETIISADDVAGAMASRAERPLLIVDIAVPRDVEGAARDVANVHLFDIDDLELAAEANLEARRREVGAVEQIVEAEAARFEVWLSQQKATPTIAALRRRAEATRKAELERTLARLGHLSDEDRRRIEAMSDALVRRLLHEPVTRLRQHGSERHVEALRELFGLDED